MPTFLRAVHKSEIPEGSGKPVKVGNEIVALFNIDGAFHAIDNLCPHRGASLGDGAVDGCKVICPWHGWEFDIRTGNLAMSEGVRTYRVEVREDEVWVEV